MTVKSDRVYLQQILECSALIQEYTKGEQTAFMRNNLIQDGMIRRLQTLAEWTRRLSDDLKEQAPSADWRAITGFQNILIHDYSNGLDIKQVWNISENYVTQAENGSSKTAWHNWRKEILAKHRQLAYEN